MSFFRSPFIKKYLLPGFVFQSVVIAGGYGTGREIIEYFLSYGPLGGLLGMLLITTVLWSVTLAVTFEFARLFKAYDYRTFFKNLLGRAWFVFEIIYILFLFIVLAVIGSAAGILLRDNFGIPYFVGVTFMLAAVGFLTFKGSGLIENVLSFWSVVLYLIYAVFFAAALFKFGPAIKQNLTSGILYSGWIVGGLKYAFYNLATVAAVFFCLDHIETRKEAITSGLLAGVIGIIPALLFYISVLGHYPQILPEEIPAIHVLQEMGIPALLIAFQIVLFGTLIETGTGMIHAVNERIRAALKAKGKEMKSWQRPVVAVFFLTAALGFSTFGLIALIEKGYGALSWGFLLVFIIPLFTIGVFKIIRKSPARRKNQ